MRLWESAILQSVRVLGGWVGFQEMRLWVVVGRATIRQVLERYRFGAGGGLEDRLYGADR